MATDGATNITCDTGNSQPICTANDNLGSKLCGLFVQWNVFVCGILTVGYTVALLVEVLCYKPEGHRFNSRWGHLDFSVT